MNHSKLLPCLTTILLVTIMGAARGQSTAGNPSAQPPGHPLPSGENEISTGLVTLTEMSPEAAERTSTVGTQLMVRHALSDRVAVGARAWATLTGFGEEKISREGIGLEVALNKSYTKAEREIGVTARGSALFMDNSIVGGEMDVSIIAWLPHLGVAAPYFALGPTAGWYTRAISEKDEFFMSILAVSIYPTWVYGIDAAAGLSIDAIDDLSLRLELGGTIQDNTLEHTTYFIFTPSVNIAWRL